MHRANLLIGLLAVISCRAAAAAASHATPSRNHHRGHAALLLHRRTLMGRALTALTCPAVGFAALPAQASKFPQHVEDLDRAATSGDSHAVQLALRVLALPSDEATAQLAIEPIGDATTLSPKTDAVNERISSFKVSVSAPGNDNVVYMWLARADTGGLVGVKQVAPGSAPTFTCSVPKLLLPNDRRLSLLPCVYSPSSGIWRGEPIVLDLQ